MMIIVLVAMIVVLAAALCITIFKYINQSAQVSRITDQISDFNEGKSKEEILIITDERSIQKLMVKINSLLQRQISLETRHKMQEESDRKMLANISHDLKTPLTVIYGYSEMLLSGSDIENQSARLKVEKIHSKANDVMEMIHLFFDLVKIESGELFLENQPINLSEVCRSEIVNYFDMLEDAGFQVEIQIPNEDIIMAGDMNAIKRILTNLIQNAFRYGVDGKYLELELSSHEDGIHISITDKGKGIVEDHQDKIFERLVTLEDSRNKKYQGSGLGLTITKRLVEAMGGKIELKSVPYQKTTFTIIFPSK